LDEYLLFRGASRRQRFYARRRISKRSSQFD
jgi:hypothetical protein